MPRWVVELLACWKGRLCQNDFNIIWNVIPSHSMWFIWREMNAWSFEDCEKTSSKLQLWFLESLFEWNSVNAPLSISEFVDLCALLPHSWSWWLFLSCLDPVYLRCAPFTFNEFALLIKNCFFKKEKRKKAVVIIVWRSVFRCLKLKRVFKTLPNTPMFLWISCASL